MSLFSRKKETFNKKADRINNLIRERGRENEVNSFINKQRYGEYKKLARRVDTFPTGITNFIRKTGYKKPMFTSEGTRIPSKVNRGSNFGRRGRPKGTLDSRYAKYGGVYGYRKFMSQQRQLERIQAERRAMMSPQESQALDVFRRQQMAQQQSPENQTIPDTNGRVRLKNIHQEVDDYANEIP